jgi:hypothetical protein
MGAAGRAWFPSHFSSIMLAGYGCMGMGHAGFLASGVERESGENDLNMRSEEEAAQCRSKRHRAGFFFFEEKEKKLGVTQKWVMTTTMKIRWMKKVLLK